MFKKKNTLLQMKEQAGKVMKWRRALLGIHKTKDIGPLVVVPVKVKHPPQVKPKKIPQFKRKPADWAYFYHPVERRFKPFDNGYGFGSRLLAKGFKKLGSGHFSTVYAKDGSDKVIKVTHRPDNWIEYIQWSAKKGYCGNLAPRVYSYKMIKGKQQAFSVAVVERMEKCANRIDMSKDTAMLAGLTEYFGRHNNTLAGLFLEEINPGMSQFVRELYKDFAGKLDLHGENSMVRKDGTYCFTDPVYDHNYTPKVKRLKAGDLTPATATFFMDYLIECSYRY